MFEMCAHFRDDSSAETCSDILRSETAEKGGTRVWPALTPELRNSAISDHAGPLADRAYFPLMRFATALTAAWYLRTAVM